MGNVAICAEELSKRYQIGKREYYMTLRDTLAKGFAYPFRRSKRIPASHIRTPNSGADSVWALKDVSFEVNHGEVVGIIGPNGAGKTTLLKILSRITEPTKGTAEIRGRVGSLLEVGTGFHPELTGRENVYLNGAILGMRRSEIEKRFDHIVAFAETERFVDTPVKHYSTGMTVRLAFSVAAHLEPEILLVDEVLAVGDAAFQRRCLGKMEDVARAGRTVLFVSHNMGAVQSLCNRAVWIDQGKVKAIGGVQKVVTDYLEESSRGFVQRNLESDWLRIEKVVLRDRQNTLRSSFRPGEDLVVEIDFFAKRRIEKPYFWISVVGHQGSVFGANMLFDGHRPDAIEGQGQLVCTLKSIPLLPQGYSLRMGARAGNGVTFLIKSADVAFFTVQGTARSLGWEGEMADSLIGEAAPVFVPYEWGLPDGKVISVDAAWERVDETSFSNS